MLTLPLFIITSAGTNVKTRGLPSGVRNTAVLSKRSLTRTIKFLQIFGPEKLGTVFVERSHQVSTKFIAYIMKGTGLYSIRTNGKADHLRLKSSEFPNNQIQQRFKAQTPNQIWVSDVTRFKVKGNYFYIYVIPGLFSREVIAHVISKKNSTQLVTLTFKRAISCRDYVKSLAFHSDRGSQ